MLEMWFSDHVNTQHKFGYYVHISDFEFPKKYTWFQNIIHVTLQAVMAELFFQLDLLLTSKKINCEYI